MNSKAKLTWKENIIIVGKALKISIKTKSTPSKIISIIGFLAAFLPVYIANVLNDFTNQIQNLSMEANIGLTNIIQTFILLISLYIIQSLYSFLSTYSLGKDALRTQRYISREVLECTCDVKYKYIENYDDFRERIAFCDTHAGQTVGSSIQAVILWLQTFITFISIAVKLFQVNGWIVLILIATSIPAVILAYLQKDEMYVHTAKYMKEHLMVVRYFHMCGGEEAVQEVRFFQIFPYMKKRWKEFVDIYLNKKKELTKKHVGYNMIADILQNVVYVGILLIACYEIFMNPAIGLGTFMLVFTLSGQMQETTKKLFVSAAQFYSDIGYMKDFFGLRDLEMDIPDENAKPLDQIEISFENVDFKYPNSEKEVLQDINVTIKNGEKIAIVGENGSGKSTFISLLCGMYQPTNGTIKVNGNDINSQMTALRRSSSVVFQEFGKYDDTLRNNIIISNQEKEVKDEDIMALMKKVNAYDVVEKQPNKLDEEIGIFSLKGNNLSGGQWQKVALARAVYREKAKLMVLDEPTSALDPIAEANLYSDFAKVTGDKTTILISHRLGITKIVDRILVFKDGKIIESGSHDELMKKNGYYTKMYQAQSKWYEEI